MVEQLDFDLKEILYSTDDNELDQYSEFKAGEIKLRLIGSCSSGYDEADKWEYWCYNGRLFFWMILSTERKNLIKN